MLNRRISQRRKNSRAEVNWPVTVVCRQSTIQGTVKNLSRGGALLYLQERVDLHESIRVAIEIPEINDVISAVGEVVRIFPLRKKNMPFSSAAGVKFTEISDENLRFITGNFAPEWHKNYKEPKKQFLLRSVFLKPIFYGAAGVLILFLFTYVFLIYNENKVDPGRITALENKLEKLDSQLKISQNATTLLNRNLKEQFLSLQGELSHFKNNFVTMATVDQLQAQIDSNQEKTKEMFNISVKEYVEASKGDPAYHLVKKGENLYRIALRYGIDVKKIRELNNLTINYSIYPGQKLIVEKL